MARVSVPDELVASVDVPATFPVDVVEARPGARVKVTLVARSGPRPTWTPEERVITCNHEGLASTSFQVTWTRTGAATLTARGRYLNHIPLVSDTAAVEVA